MPDSPPRRALVIVDMSVEQVAGISYNARTLISNCHKLAESEYFNLRIDCRLWLRSPDESSLSWVWPETAKTMFVAGSKGASLIPELGELSSGLAFVPKNNYSCFANSTLLSTLLDENIEEVYVCGINTDYCVFATALDSFQNKLRTFVVEDAISSMHGKEAHQDGLRNFVKHFGDEVLVKTEDCIARPRN